MIEQMLSPIGRGIYYVGLAITVAYVIALHFTGHADQINAWQASFMNDGYYPVLTFLILGLPGIVASFAIAFAFDAIAGKSNSNGPYGPN